MNEVKDQLDLAHNGQFRRDKETPYINHKG